MRGLCQPTAQQPQELGSCAGRWGQAPGPAARHISACRALLSSQRAAASAHTRPCSDSVHPNGADASGALLQVSQTQLQDPLLQGPCTCPLSSSQPGLQGLSSFVAACEHVPYCGRCAGGGRREGLHPASVWVAASGGGVQASRDCRLHRMLAACVAVRVCALICQLARDSSSAALRVSTCHQAQWLLQAAEQDADCAAHHSATALLHVPHLCTALAADPPAHGMPLAAAAAAEPSLLSPCQCCTSAACAALCSIHPRHRTAG